MQQDRLNKPETARTEQAIANWGFDEEFKVPLVELAEFDGEKMIRKPSNVQNVYMVLGATYTYICKAPVGVALATAKWQVCRIENATGSKMWADANFEYDNVASDPTLLSYSYS